MPRELTGRRRGRPKGSGQLGEQTRLTVRIPQPLYEQLQIYAEVRAYTRGAPQLAVCVREALEAYLANKGQTENVPSGSAPISRQTKKNISGQTRNVKKRAAANIGQTKNSAGRNLRQTRKIAATPPFDPEKYVLGKLCPRRHDYEGTGYSLLRRTNRHCLACDREKFHERKQTKRQALP